MHLTYPGEHNPGEHSPGRHLAICLLIVLLSATACFGQEDRVLYSRLEIADLDLTNEQAARLEAYESDPTTAEVEIVRIDLEVVRQEGDLRVVLPAGAELDFENEKVERRADDDFSWFGQTVVDAQAIPAEMTLVIRGDDVVGTIQTGGEVYRIRPLGGGLHAVLSVDLNALPPDHPPDSEN